MNWLIRRGVRAVPITWQQAERIAGKWEGSLGVNKVYVDIICYNAGKELCLNLM